MKVHHIVIFENHLRIEAGPVLAAELRAINHKLDHIIMSEQNLADQLTAALADLKAEIGNTAQRVLDALAALPTTGDVSPQLQAAIDGITADVTSLKAIAATPPPAP